MPTKRHKKFKKKSRKLKKKTETKNNNKNNNKNRIQNGGNKNKLTVQLICGLGNRLFQIYAGLGFAEKWNMDFYLPNIKSQTSTNHISIEESYKEIKQLFPNLNILNENEDMSSYVSIDENENENLIYNTYENPNANAIIKGYFQTEKYFPTNPPKLQIPIPSNNILENLSNMYFIHIRLGDYVGGFMLDLINYHKYCINKINTIDPNSRYIVLSDDISGSKEYITKNLTTSVKNNILYDESTNRLDSLYYMSKCVGGIGANSSFSWFGAYSIENKNKDVLFFPKPWFKSYPKENDVYPSWATIVDIDSLTNDNGTK